MNFVLAEQIFETIDLVKTNILDSIKNKMRFGKTKILDLVKAIGFKICFLKESIQINNLNSQVLLFCKN